MNLTIVYITSREEPRFDWFFDSLQAQKKHGDTIKVIVVDLLFDSRRGALKPIARGQQFWHCQPMPNVWQGKWRLTSQDWWAIATAKNTGLCLCATDYIAFTDDRSVLGPDWLNAVRDGLTGNYVVCGAYEKVHNLDVFDGRIKSFSEVAGGKDLRVLPKNYNGKPVKCPGSWLYGCTQAMPLEWALEANGFDETCNGLGLEDTLFGAMLVNNKRPLRYDPRMKIIEDRTPDKLGKSPVRADKGISPQDKSHALVARLINQKRALHQRNLREIRSTMLNGGAWPVPTEPKLDWWDGQPLEELTLPN